MPWVLSTDSSLFSFETDSSDSQQEITQQGYPTQCKKRWNYCIITVQKHILSLAEVIRNRWMAFGLKKHPWADLPAQHHRQPERLCHGLSDSWLSAATGSGASPSGQPRWGGLGVRLAGCEGCTQSCWARPVPMEGQPVPLQPGTLSWPVYN